MAHTPVPWFVNDEFHEIVTGDNVFIVSFEGEVMTEEESDNAAFIVRAVNAYDDLLAVCKRVLLSTRWSESSDRMDDDQIAYLLRSAIEKASGLVSDV